MHFYYVYYNYQRNLYVYCVATQDELVSLDNAVATEGGTARAYYIYGC